MPTTTSAPQQSITATTNSGIAQDQSMILGTAVIPQPKKIYQDNKDLDDWGINLRVFRDNQKDIFTVKFKDLKGQQGMYHFDLLPALENRNGGSIKAGDVPEVKPGILRVLETRHKNIVVPGATNIVQSIGIRSSLINLVGAFTGAEGRTAAHRHKEDVLLAKYGDKLDANETDSYTKASSFYNDVVLPMTEVTVTVQASRGERGVIKMVYQGVIIKFKDYSVRSNRNYYTIDLLVTKYISHGMFEVKKEEDEEKAVEGKTEQIKADIKRLEADRDEAIKKRDDIESSLAKLREKEGVEYSYQLKTPGAAEQIAESSRLDKLDYSLLDKINELKKQVKE